MSGVTGDVLELIDNTLYDIRVSDDAMRWRPQRPPITPEQAQAAMRVLGAHLVQVANNLRTAFEQAAVMLKPVMDAWAVTLRKVVKLRAEIDQRQRVRLRQMHTAYHRKTRRR